MVISAQVSRKDESTENIELVAHEADMAVAALDHFPAAFAMGRQTAEFSGLLIKSGTEISSEAATSIALNVSTIASMFQVENKEVLKAAHEGETTPIGNVMVAHEGLKEVLKAGWENLKKLFRAAANGVRKLMQTIHSKLFKIQDKLKETSKELKKIKLTKDEDLEIKESSLIAFKKEFITSLKNDATLDGATLKDITAYFTGSKDYGKTLRENITTLLKTFSNTNAANAAEIAKGINKSAVSSAYVGNLLSSNSKIADIKGMQGLENSSVNVVSAGNGKITALIIGNIGQKLVYKVVTDDIEKIHIDRLKETKKDEKFVGPDIAEVLDAAAKEVKDKDKIVEKLDEVIKKIDEDVADAKKLTTNELKALSMKKNFVQQITSPTVHAIKTNGFERYRKVVAILNFGEAALDALKAIKKKDKSKKKDSGEKTETPKDGEATGDQNSDAAVISIDELY